MSSNLTQRVANAERLTGKARQRSYAGDISRNRVAHVLQQLRKECSNGNSLKNHAGSTRGPLSSDDAQTFEAILNDPVIQVRALKELIRVKIAASDFPQDLSEAAYRSE